MCVYGSSVSAVQLQWCTLTHTTFNSNKFGCNTMRHSNQNLWTPSSSVWWAGSHIVYTLLQYIYRTHRSFAHNQSEEYILIVSTTTHTQTLITHTQNKIWKRHCSFVCIAMPFSLLHIWPLAAQTTHSILLLSILAKSNRNVLFSSSFSFSFVPICILSVIERSSIKYFFFRGDRFSAAQIFFVFKYYTQYHFAVWIWNRFSELACSNFKGYGKPKKSKKETHSVVRGEKYWKRNQNTKCSSFFRAR